MDKRLVIIGRR